MDAEPYHADPSLKGKLRRRVVRLQHRRPATARPGRSMISFSFDDAPLSAFTRGAEVLERHGARGTYFVCAGTAGETSFVGPLGARQDMARVKAAGHEIACHTFSHLDCGQAGGSAADADLALNSETLEAWGLGRPETFAYPFGDVGPRAKRRIADRFTLARALHPGVVKSGCDLAQAPAVGVEGEAGEARALRWMRAARRDGGWLILFTHQVEQAPTRYGCTVRTLDRLVQRAVEDGFEVVTVAEGARRLRADA